MKQVYDTSEIAHLWAHQSQTSARNKTGNFSFQSRNLCSYSTIIASLVKVKGKEVALLADRNWSMTTNKHQGLARLATSHLERFSVKNYIPNNGKVDHKHNLNEFKNKLADLEAKFLKSRNNAGYIWSQIQNHCSLSNRYCYVFGLITIFKTSIDEVTAGNILKKGLEFKEQLTKARDAKWKEYEERRVREQNALWSEAPINFQNWLDGKTNEKNWPHNYLENKAYGRIIGSDLQTTLGAVVPVEHIQRVSSLVRKIIKEGKEFIPNGHTIHLGHYQIDRISNDGNLYAGCHTFEKAEVLRILDICNK
jgi:hypothetical protein